jgi:hypothetical protein
MKKYIEKEILFNDIIKCFLIFWKRKIFLHDKAKWIFEILEKENFILM